MSLTQEILAALPATKSNAMTSVKIFNVCKGAENSNQIAKLLSQLFGQHKLNRNTNAAGKYQYWLKENISQQTSIETQTPENNRIEIEPILDLNKTANAKTFESVKAHFDAIDDEILIKAATAETVNLLKTKLEAMQTDIPSILKKSDGMDIRPFKSLLPDFKVGITSEGTILIFGINYEAIELSAEQSKVLCNFVGNSKLSGLIG